MFNVTRIITLRYWTQCNVRCSFCFEHLPLFKQKFNKFTTPSKESIIVHNDILESFYTKDNRTIIKFMGGELFCYNDKELYEGFDDTVTTLNKIQADKRNVVIFTNLLYTDLSLLTYFIDSLFESQFYPELSVSFDLFGRFQNNEQIDLLVSTITTLQYYYRNRISIKLNVTLTRENMDIIASQKYCKELEAFNELYKFVPVMLASTHIDLVNGLDAVECNKQFIQTLIDKYPKCLDQFFSEDYERSLKYEYYSIQSGQLYNDVTNFTETSIENTCLLCDKFNICNHLQKFLPYTGPINTCISKVALDMIPLPSRVQC